MHLDISKFDSTSVEDLFHMLYW